MTSIKQDKAYIFLFVCKQDFIDSSIYFPLLFLPIFSPTYKILQYCNFLEFININTPILKLQVKPIPLQPLLVCDNATKDSFCIQCQY